MKNSDPDFQDLNTLKPSNNGIRHFRAWELHNLL